MNTQEKYDILRDNISLGLAQIGRILDENGTKTDFIDVFDYVVLQLKELDSLFSELNYRTGFKSLNLK